MSLHMRDPPPPRDIISPPITDSRPSEGEDSIPPIEISNMGEDLGRKGVFPREGHERGLLEDGTNMYHTEFQGEEANG